MFSGQPRSMRTLIFSLKTFDLYLDFITFTVEEVDSHTYVVPNMFKGFPITELRLHFLKSKFKSITNSLLGVGDILVNKIHVVPRLKGFIG